MSLWYHTVVSAVVSVKNSVEREFHYGTVRRFACVCVCVCVCLVFVCVS